MKKQTKTSILKVAVFSGLSMLATSSAYACNAAEPTLGSVCMTAATFCPRGYVDANGQLLPVSQFSALFSLLGTNYGGDGRNTFGVPDLRGRTPLGLGRGPGLSDIRQGEKRGAETTTLLTTNMPAHNHSAHAVNTDGTGPAANDTWPANPVADNRGTPMPTTAYAASGEAVTLNPGVVGSTGGNIPFNNVPPQIGIRFCLATVGVFPSRN